MVLVLLVIHADRNTVRYLPYAMHRNHRNRRQIMVTKGERVRGGINQEYGINRYKLLNIKQISNRIYCIAQGTMFNILKQTMMERNMNKNVIAESFCCAAEINTSQIKYSSIKLEKEKETVYKNMQKKGKQSRRANIYFLSTYYILCLCFVLDIYCPFKTHLKNEVKTPPLIFIVLVVVVQLLSCVQLLQPHGLQPARLLCPWHSPGKNTGVGSHFLLQGIFPTQGSNLGLPHCRQIVYL